jgi:signal-transduction protein with cAMP-binding, CBS, and nucleotidyltransferase domain
VVENRAKKTNKSVTKPSSDIFWLRDESLEGSGDLLASDVLAQEVVKDLEAALEHFREIAAKLVRGSTQVENKASMAKHKSLVTQHLENLSRDVLKHGKVMGSENILAAQL